jgi:hypothetical protein
MNFKQKWAIAQVLLLFLGIFLISTAKPPAKATNEVKMTPRPTYVEKQRDGADIWMDMAKEQSMHMLLDD